MSFWFQSYYFCLLSSLTKLLHCAVISYDTWMQASAHVTVAHFPGYGPGSWRHLACQAQKLFPGNQALSSAPLWGCDTEFVLRHFPCFPGISGESDWSWTASSTPRIVINKLPMDFCFRGVWGWISGWWTSVEDGGESEPEITPFYFYVGLKCSEVSCSCGHFS